MGGSRSLGERAIAGDAIHPVLHAGGMQYTCSAEQQVKGIIACETTIQCSPCMTRFGLYNLTLVCIRIAIPVTMFNAL